MKYKKILIKLIFLFPLFLLFSCEDVISYLYNEKQSVTIKFNYISSLLDKGNDTPYILEIEIYKDEKLVVNDRNSIGKLYSELESKDYDLEVGENYYIKAYLYNMNISETVPELDLESRIFNVEIGPSVDVSLYFKPYSFKEIEKEAELDIDLVSLSETTISETGMNLGAIEWFSLKATSNKTKITLDQDGFSSVLFIAKYRFDSDIILHGASINTRPGETYYIGVLSLKTESDKSKLSFINNKSSFTKIRWEEYVEEDLGQNTEETAIDITNINTIHSKLEKSYDEDYFTFKGSLGVSYKLSCDTPLDILAETEKNLLNYGPLYPDKSYNLYVPDGENCYIRVSGINRHEYKYYSLFLEPINLFAQNIQLTIYVFNGRLSMETDRRIDLENDELIVRVIKKLNSGSSETIKEDLYSTRKLDERWFYTLTLELEAIEDRSNLYVQGFLRDKQGVTFGATFPKSLEIKENNFYTTSFLDNKVYIGEESYASPIITGEMSRFALVEVRDNRYLNEYLGIESPPMIIEAEMISKPIDSVITTKDIEIVKDGFWYSFNFTPDKPGEYKINTIIGEEGKCREYMVTVIAP